jgi:NAD(P)-dependent dehydrogenase (short-subunit alcohol dehydrogenase family)
MSGWNADDIGDQSGRVAVVTGANSGIGFVAARELAKAGATVVLAARSREKADGAAAKIASAAPGAETETGILDLADLSSVSAFAQGVQADHPKVDLLVNNAGVMMTPRSETKDGFELQFGTNHLGHFALSGQLLDALRAAPTGARVVTISSIEHKPGKIDFDDIPLDEGYGPRSAYQRSKLSNALFGIELDRRLRAAGSDVKSVLAHPGYSNTNLQFAGPTGIMKTVFRVVNPIFAQSPEKGALPTLFAAVAPDVDGGDFIGPNGIGEFRGNPTKVQATALAQDPTIGAQLWEVSEEMTGVRFGLPEAPAT